MKVHVKKKDESNIKTGATVVVDKHKAKMMKRLARNRFYQRQVNMPDGE